MKKALYVFSDDNTKYIAFPAEPIKAPRAEQGSTEGSVVAGHIEVATYTRNTDVADTSCSAFDPVEEDVLLFISAPIDSAASKDDMIAKAGEALLCYSAFEEDDVPSVAAKLAGYKRDKNTIFVLLDESGFIDTPAWAKLASRIASYSYNGTSDDLAVVLVTCDHRVTEEDWPGCSVLYV